METRPLTDAEKAQHNPPFNFARATATVTTAPPFTFDDTTMMFFPLRADINTLQSLIDDYLNLAPEFAYFRAAMPYVFMMVNHYPKMGLAHGNGGWISQDEVLFLTPVEWYERTPEGLKYRATAQFSPFAFVDKDASQIEGREVYGWPKVQCWIESSPSAWLTNPRQNRTLLELNANGFEALYSDDYDEMLPLIDVRQAAPPAISTLPPDPTGLLNPFAAIANTVADFNRLTVSTWQWAQHNIKSMGRIGVAQLSQLFSTSDTNNPLLSALVGNSINLKQLRDAQMSFSACYQAITNVEIEMMRFNRGGLLGDAYLATGDLSGGYEILVHDYPSVPIIDTLGIQVEDSPPGGPIRLRPVMPFWTQMDLNYMRGENIAWRGWDGKDALWRDHEKIQVRPSTSPPHPAPYMTDAGANFQVAEGPFNMPGASMEVLPLLADRDTLNRFLQGGHDDTTLDNIDWQLSDALLPKSLLSQLPKEFGHFEAWGEYVYMVISHFDKVESQTNDFGTVSEDKVTFSIPVRYLNANDELVGTGFVVAYQYSNNDIASTTGRELYGYPMISAGVDAQVSNWLDGHGPYGPQTLVSVDVDMPAALLGDQPFEWNTLLEVVEGNVIDQDDAYRWQRTRGFNSAAKESLAAFQSAQAGAPQEFEDLLGLASNLLSGTALRQFSFKQFRDAAVPSDACYQAFVETGLSVDRVYEQKEIEQPVHVNIFRYPTQPIAESLGLKIKSSHEDERGRCDCVQAIRPFYLRADMSTTAARNLSWRTGTRQWQPLSLPPLRRSTYRPSVLSALNDNPMHLTQDLPSLANGPNRNINPSRLPTLTANHQPQAILGAVLSREWGSTCNSRYRRQKALAAEISAVEARLATRGVHSDELMALEARLNHLRHCSHQRLPDHVLCTAGAGPVTGRDFPIQECLPTEDNPGYWTPSSPR
ncbi:MAG: hypothetical protein GKR90_15665 [Pseudomonadales bacterium]|nr:hypothetical protein [Pseudomonadales bacterium]